MSALAEQLAFDGPGRVIAPAPVMTAHHGRNADMIASVARLYIPDGAKVLDATYGKGNFWARTDTSRFLLLGADLESPAAHVTADFTLLPFADRAFDVVVLDPPYIHAPGNRHFEERYRNRSTTRHLGTHADVMNLYYDGIAEAARVLRPGGTLWVKCQDTVESRAQRWSHIEIYQDALELGFSAQDLFTVMTDTPPGGGREVQHHARRNHSYLWIFRKGHR